MSRAAKAAVALLLTVLVPLTAVVGWTLVEYYRSGPLAAETTVIIPKGEGVRAIAARLTDAGVIGEPLVFRLGARLARTDGALRAGEYAFAAGISVRDVIEMLAEGRTVVRRLTVPEGLLSAEVVGLVEAAEGLDGEAGPPPAEGSLLPETYHFSYGDNRADVLRRMAAAMKTTLAQLWQARAPDLPLATPEEALILASIVEKETGVAAERPRVAAVFINRLRNGMPLQSDPTVAYGLAREIGPLTRPLTLADLRRPSPYNTYLIQALPPGPIANPGRAALEAVMNPLHTDDLYFVADGNGGHAFARTIEQHNRNVAEWRKIQRKLRRERAEEPIPQF